MIQGTKGCLYNCGESCTGECLVHQADKENFLETGPTIKRRSLMGTLSLFPDGENRYQKDPYFHQTIDYLCLGGAPEVIIEQLLQTIKSQNKSIEELSLQIPLRFPKKS